MSGSESDAREIVDLSAIEHNVAILAAATFDRQSRAQVMAIVSEDAFGHGLVPAARAVLAGGARWLGAARVDEALALREAGFTEPVFSWVWDARNEASVELAVEASVDLSVATHEQLEAVCRASVETEVLGRVHLEVDTRPERADDAELLWEDLLEAAAEAQATADVEIVGIWSRLAHADERLHPDNNRQLNAYHSAVKSAVLHGIIPQLRHVANSAAILGMPGTHLDLVRAGRSVYGIEPVAGRDYGLLPAKRLVAEVAVV
ncbi:alanine racemase [Humibacter sp. RRB41]|uniref:alanine racemase n=1 Tax=Humibacter sp. RRB41 TaxID=2919946 RepID=UPI001FAB1D09|nr:alanine racemase [Humibacter sp. RRB41]